MMQQKTKISKKEKTYQPEHVSTAQRIMSGMMESTMGWAGRSVMYKKRKAGAK